MFKKKLKKGDITINHQSDNNLVKTHCIVNTGDNKGFLLTSKEKPKDGAKTYAIDQYDVSSFAIKGSAYITNQQVDNNTGKVIGKLKPDSLAKFLQWIAAVGTVCIIVYILT